MSDLHARHTAAAYARGRNVIRQQNEAARDQARGEFLLALEKSNLQITDGEAGLLVRFINQPKSAPMKFSPAQRAAIDEIVRKYQPLITQS